MMQKQVNYWLMLLPEEEEEEEKEANQSYMLATLRYAD
jgi:hypothetical protein